MPSPASLFYCKNLYCKEFVGAGFSCPPSCQPIPGHCRVRQSGHFLETGSLHPPPAALRRFPRPPGGAEPLPYASLACFRRGDPCGRPREGQSPSPTHPLYASVGATLAVARPGLYRTPGRARGPCPTKMPCRAGPMCPAAPGTINNLSVGVGVLNDPSHALSPPAGPALSFTAAAPSGNPPPRRSSRSPARSPSHAASHLRP